MNSSTELTIGLLWHSTNSDNLGVGALTASQIAIVDKVAAGLGTKVTYKVLAWADTGADYIEGARIAPVRMRTRDLVRPVGGLFSAARSCDMILDIGAGDSFADIYGVGRCLKILTSKVVVLISGRPLILSPQTIGPFERRWTRWLAAQIIARTEKVLTRDRLSTAYLSEMGVRRKPIEATDVAFRLPYTKVPERQDQVIRIGLNVSGLLMSGGYSKDNMFGLKADYPSVIRGIVSDFLDRPGCEVHLISHVRCDRPGVEDDYSACVSLAEEFPGTIVAPRFHGPSDAKSYISGMDFFTGARMHACIAAFSSGVVTMPMAYSRKFAGLFGTLEYDLVADCRSDTEAEIRRKICDAFEARTELKARIETCFEEAERRLGLYEDALRDCFLAIGTGR